MAGDTRQTKVTVDGDGIRSVETAGVRGAVWLLVAAVLLVGIAAIMVVRPLLQGNASESSPALARQSSASGTRDPLPAAPAPPRVIKAVEGHDGRVDRAPASAETNVQPPQPPVPALQKAQERMPVAAVPSDEAEEKVGIYAFPPPGTKPIKRGIIVPEDFKLPAGYVRHYQSTDDGRQLPAILMFHPDYQPVDEHGQAIPLPADRVVPPDMAPAGLPVQLLEVPEDTAPRADVPVDPDVQDPAP